MELTKELTKQILTDLNIIETEKICTPAQFLEEVTEYPDDFTITPEQLKYVIDNREQLTKENL